MIWKISCAMFLILMLSCKQDKAYNFPAEKTKQVAKTNYLIEAEELLEIIKQSNIKIIDFRKAEDYNKAHIVGALNMWRTDIEDASYAYKGMMANKTQIEKLFSKLGISNTDTLVIYDDNGLCDSARLWWLLQNYDFTKVKLLNGGFTAWNAINGITTTVVPKPITSKFILPKKSSMKLYVSKAEMLQYVNNNTLILDTRTPDEFSGKQQKKGALKGGRIPNSKLIDWANAINYNTNKKIKSVKALQNIYGNLTASKTDTIVVYCHSGVRSAHTTFVLTQILGYNNVKNYDGSWTEWSHFSNLPYQQDSLTTILK